MDVIRMHDTPGRCMLWKEPRYELNRWLWGGGGRACVNILERRKEALPAMVYVVLNTLHKGDDEKQ